MGCVGSVPLFEEEEILWQKDVAVGGMSPAQFIFESEDRIAEHYKIDTRSIGVGQCGVVCKAKHKITGATRAVKTISKAQIKKSKSSFKQEVALMKMMDHPNIIKLHETFEDRRNVYLVMEFGAGGELFDCIISSAPFTEVQTAIVMQQIVRAINYLHGNCICHRDLKPENFLFMTKDTIHKSMLKIIDFGASCKFEANQKLSTRIGTPYYVAPEVLMGAYNHLCDLWSCGVIMYMMLCGYPPFAGETEEEVLPKIRQGSWTFGVAWDHISEDAKNLVRNLLEMNSQSRCTAEQALNHEWTRSKAPKADSVPLQSNFVDNLRSFGRENTFKKAALQIIAGQLNEAQIRELRKVFLSFDRNGDGSITLSEMKDGISEAGLKEINDLCQIVSGIDMDGSGMIDYTEFIAAMLDWPLYVQEDICWSAFHIFDRNGDGKISQGEIKTALSNTDVSDVVGPKSIEELLSEIDSNGDGEIDFQEFMQMMRGVRQ